MPKSNKTCPTKIYLSLSIERESAYARIERTRARAAAMVSKVMHYGHTAGRRTGRIITLITRHYNSLTHSLTQSVSLSPSLFHPVSQSLSLLGAVCVSRAHYSSYSILHVLTFAQVYSRGHYINHIYTSDCVSMGQGREKEKVLQRDFASSECACKSGQWRRRRRLFIDRSPGRCGSSNRRARGRDLRQTAHGERRTGGGFIS